MKQISYVCAEEEVHEADLGRVRAAMPPAERLFLLADFYKAFADGTRVRILYALDCRELCVCDIAALLGLTVSAVSHQLRFLRDANLVKYRREGKTVFYSLADDHVRTVVECGMEHICENRTPSEY